MVSMGLLNPLKDSDEFAFTINEKNNFLAQFNRNKIIDWGIKNKEQELISLDGYRDFIHLTYIEGISIQTRFFELLTEFSYQFLSKRFLQW